MHGDRIRQFALKFTFDWLPTVIKVAIVSCAIALATLVFAQVWLRYVIKAPLLWVEEMAVFPAFWLYLLGAAYGAYTRTHIRVDLMDVLLKDAQKRQLARIVTSVITVVVSFMFVSWGYSAFVWDLGMDQRSYTLLLPMIFARSSIFFGGIFIAYYFVVELIDLIGQYRGRPPLLVTREEDMI